MIVAAMVMAVIMRVAVRVTMVPAAGDAPGHPQPEQHDGAVAQHLERRGMVEDASRADIEHRDQQADQHDGGDRSEEHTSELQSLMRISYAVFCLKKKNNTNRKKQTTQQTIQQRNHSPQQ